jgi:hypothetical protein
MSTRAIMPARKQPVGQRFKEGIDHGGSTIPAIVKAEAGSKA